ncbi:MAG: hypothetical protein HKN42_15885 [Granulosicoccus sp.]|nr:hypothetical protein [Granulosicoccus sp.]
MEPGNYLVINHTSATRYPDITIMAPDSGSTGFSVDADNLDSVLATIAEATSGRPATTAIDLARKLVFGEFDNRWDLLSEENGASFRETIQTYRCGSDGSLVRTILDLGDASSRALTLTRCELDGQLLSVDLIAESGLTFIITITNLTMDDPGTGKTVLSGSYTDARGSSGSGVQAMNVRYLRSDTLGGSVLDYSFDGYETDTELDVSWRQRNYTAGNVWFTATTDEVFRRTSRDQEYDSGKLSVDVLTGPAIAIDAANGNSQQFTVTVQDENATSSFVLDWSADNRFALEFE